MRIMKIIDSTDEQFIGLNVDIDSPIFLNGTPFLPDKSVDFENGVTRLSNSNYSIDLVEVKNGKNHFAQFNSSWHESNIG